MTGSGMGCPDWPKCFGYWIPPTSIEQLPVDYKIQFKVAGKEIADFSAIKTWIEYINRLIGAFTGLIILVCFGLAIPHRKKYPGIFWYALLCLLLVALVGWLGSKVVSTNLMPGMITIHMLGAVLVATAMILAVSHTENRILNLTKQQVPTLFLLRKVWMFSLALAFIQLILGTQVREEIDHIAQKIAGRELWIEMLSWKFYVHRSLSLLILGVALWIYKMSKFLQNPSLLLWSRHHLVLILCAVIAGVVLAYLNMPAIVQPVHLLIGVSVCGVLVYLGRMLYAPMKEQE